MELVHWILAAVVFGLVGLAWWQPWAENDDRGHPYPAGPSGEREDEERNREQ